MRKFFWFFVIIMTFASIVFAMSQKDCAKVVKKGYPQEVCEPATPIGKWVQTNLGITF